MSIKDKVSSILRELIGASERSCGETEAKIIALKIENMEMRRLLLRTTFALNEVGEYPELLKRINLVLEGK